MAHRMSEVRDRRLEIVELVATLCLPNPTAASEIIETANRSDFSWEESDGMV